MAKPSVTCMLDIALNLMTLNLTILFQLNLHHTNIITCSFKIIHHMLLQLSEQSKKYRYYLNLWVFLYYLEACSVLPVVGVP